MGDAWAASPLAFVLLPFIMPGGTLDLNPLTGTASRFMPASSTWRSTMLIFSLFALGFNLLFGHTGELSFGHAMFFASAPTRRRCTPKASTSTLFGLPIKHGAGGNLFVALMLALRLSAAMGLVAGQR